MNDATPDVFISYARSDRERVARLASLLQSLDLVVWYDAALAGGAFWQTAIERAAREARCMIVCWSQAAASSEWVRRELEIGRHRGVLLPVLFGSGALPPDFVDQHFPNLSDWSDGYDHEGLKQLAEGIGGHVGRDLWSVVQEMTGGENRAAISQLRAALVQIARRKSEPISYEDAHILLHNVWRHGAATPMTALSGALDAIAAQNRARREPPLFGLVVSKATGRPGRGYFQKHCFLAGANSDESGTMHQAHLKRIYQYSWPYDP